MKLLLSAVVAAALGMGAASVGAGGLQGGGGGFCPVVLSRATYECPPGPGYMLWNVIDANQKKSNHQLWVGSQDICKQQAEPLRASRGTFPQLSIVAICSGQDEVYYLKRWSIDIWGNDVYQGQVYYGPLADCLDAADQMNN